MNPLGIRERLIAIFKFAIIYTLVFMFIEYVINIIGLPWGIFGIIAILFGIILLMRSPMGSFISDIAEYSIFIGVSFILYDISAIISFWMYL